MEFTKLIAQRESVRTYDRHKEVSPQTLQRVLEAGRLAPSAANRQPLEFLVVTSEEMLQKIRGCYNRSWFRDAPVIIVVKGKSDQAWKRSDGYTSIETDAAIAMDHMILAAANEQLGTCWIANFDYEKLRKALQLKDNEVVFAITPLGYPGQDYLPSGKKIRKSFDEMVRFL